MADIDYRLPWKKHLAQNACPETPLYTIAAEPRMVEAKANPECARERTLKQISDAAFHRLPFGAAREELRRRLAEVTP